MPHRGSCSAIWLLLLRLAGCGGSDGNSMSPSPVTYSLAGRTQNGPAADAASISVNEQVATSSPERHRIQHGFIGQPAPGRAEPWMLAAAVTLSV
jgi:hypothetical protein